MNHTCLDLDRRIPHAVVPLLVNRPPDILLNQNNALPLSFCSQLFQESKLQHYHWPTIPQLRSNITRKPT